MANTSEHNDKIGEYEANLRSAEKSLEKAAQAICDLRGEEVGVARYTLEFDILEKVQEAIRQTYRLYL